MWMLWVRKFVQTRTKGSQTHRHNAFQPSGCLGSRWRAGFSSQGLRVRRGVANWKFLHPAPGGRREGRGEGRVGEMYLNMLPCIWEGTLESFKTGHKIKNLKTGWEGGPRGLRWCQSVSIVSAAACYSLLLPAAPCCSLLPPAAPYCSLLPVPPAPPRGFLLPLLLQSLPVLLREGGRWSGKEDLIHHGDQLLIDKLLFSFQHVDQLLINMLNIIPGIDMLINCRTTLRTNH